MDKKNVLKSMVKTGAKAAVQATHPVGSAIYKGVQGARKAVKSTLGGMTTLKAKFGGKPSISSMPTTGTKKNLVSPRSNEEDNALLVQKAINNKKKK